MGQEFRKIRSLGEQEGRTLEDLLHEVARGRESMTFILKMGSR